MILDRDIYNIKRIFLRAMSSLMLASVSLAACAADARGDSLTCRPGVWPAVPAAAAGAGLAVTGAAARLGHPHSIAVADPGERPDRWTGAARFVPLALPWAAKALGAKTRSGWGRMAVSQGLAAAIMAGTAGGLKAAVCSPRPDGTDSRSFPSGHSAIAFMGATATAYEMGATSPWYPFGAYLLASAVAAERVADRHHYPSDVAAGAGIGILSTQLGYLLADLIMGGRVAGPLSVPEGGDAIRPYLEVSTGLRLTFGETRVGDCGIKCLPGLATALRGGLPLGERWRLSAEAAWLATPIISCASGTDTYARNLNSLGFSMLPSYTVPLSRRLSFTADAGAGYRVNLAHAHSEVHAGQGTATGRADASLSMRFTDSFSARASAGYEISHYKFSTSAATTSGTAHALTISASSVVLF